MIVNDVRNINNALNYVLQFKQYCTVEIWIFLKSSNFLKSTFKYIIISIFTNDRCLDVHLGNILCHFKEYLSYVIIKSNLNFFKIKI